MASCSGLSDGMSREDSSAVLTGKDPATKPVIVVAAPMSPTSATVLTGSAADPRSLPLAARQSVLWVMCLLKIITSYDSGAYGAVLGIEDGIAAELQMTVTEEGILGAAPFVGNTLGCALAGLILMRYDAKTVLMGGMTLHFVGTLLLGLAPSLIFAIAARVIIGFTLSFVVVYSIVWTDSFAPSNRATTWMALMNGGVPIGMLLGFMMGGSVIPSLDLSWRFTFLFKAIILLPVVWRLWTLPPHTVNEPRAKTLVGGPVSSGSVGAECQAFVKRTLSLLRNEIFVCATFSLVVLYFVVTAMQVFITSYLRGAPFYASMSTIVFGFGVTSVTAPVVGVVCGGLLVDRLGGYQGNLRRAAIFGAGCGTLAAWFGLIACYMTTFPTFIAALWFMLFSGAANVPVSTGIMMASVPPPMRSTASSYAAIAFNLFGYFMGPLVCGYLADATGSLSDAFHIVLMSSGAGVIPLCLTVWFATNAPAHTAVEDQALAQSSRPSEDATPRNATAELTGGSNNTMNTSTNAYVVEGSFAVPITPQTASTRKGTSSFDRPPEGSTSIGGVSPSTPGMPSPTTATNDANRAQATTLQPVQTPKQSPPGPTTQL